MNKTSANILVIDDDSRIRQLLAKYLRENDFTVLVAEDTKTSDQLFEYFSFDLIIVDVMMPDETGTEFTKRWKRTHNTPIIMLTALSEIDSRIEGLEAGADDYLSKPFEPRELLLRINNILSRVNNLSKQIGIYKAGIFEFDKINHKLYKNSVLIPLTSIETSLIEIFVKNPGNIFSREEISSIMSNISERSVDVQIIRLRNKIEDDPKNPLYLRTIRNQGYVFTI